MANARGKSIDNTHLSIDLATERGFIHRDYIAHCMRWSHVVKALYEKNRYKTARIMDVGCGIDVPLARTIYSQRLIPESYIGVDYNKPEKFKLDAFTSGKFPVNAYGSIDFANPEHVGFDSEHVFIKGDTHPLPNVFTCFEVVEHIEPDHVRRLLGKVLAMMRASQFAGQKPLFFLSTPNYDPGVGAADNHVNEMKHNALGWLIEDVGFEIEAEYGTFASQRDYKEVLFTDYLGSRELWDHLSDYYDSNYMATVFAPLYPGLARNCLWVLRPAGENYVPTLGYDIELVTGPWSSSSDWRDMAPNVVPCNWDALEAQRQSNIHPIVPIEELTNAATDQGPGPSDSGAAHSDGT